MFLSHILYTSALDERIISPLIIALRSSGAFILVGAFTNQAIDINTLSRRVFAHGKA
jgi:hypothetical protein